MLPPLEEASRRALVTGSLVTVICAALIVPLVGSTSGYVPAARRAAGFLKAAQLADDDPWKIAVVTVKRDPFLPEAALATAARASRPASTRDIVGMHVTAGQPISPEDGVSVLAIAFGATSKAVIEMGGTTRIIAPGDFINAARVESILPDRIVLSGGRNLMLARTSP